MAVRSDEWERSTQVRGGNIKRGIGEGKGTPSDCTRKKKAGQKGSFLPDEGTRLTTSARVPNAGLEKLGPRTGKTCSNHS